MPFQKCPFRNALYHDVLFQNVLCNALSQFALYQTAIKQERSIFIIHVISDCEISNAWGVDFRSCFFHDNQYFFCFLFGKDCPHRQRLEQCGTSKVTTGLHELEFSPIGPPDPKNRSNALPWMDGPWIVPPLSHTVPLVMSYHNCLLHQNDQFV